MGFYSIRCSILRIRRYIGFLKETLYGVLRIRRYVGFVLLDYSYCTSNVRAYCSLELIVCFSFSRLYKIIRVTSTICVTVIPCCTHTIIPSTLLHLAYEKFTSYSCCLLSCAGETVDCVSIQGPGVNSIVT